MNKIDDLAPPSVDNVVSADYMSRGIQWLRKRIPLRKEINADVELERISRGRYRVWKEEDGFRKRVKVPPRFIDMDQLHWFLNNAEFEEILAVQVIYQERWTFDFGSPLDLRMLDFIENTIRKIRKDGPATDGDAYFDRQEGCSYVCVDDEWVKLSGSPTE